MSVDAKARGTNRRGVPLTIALLAVMLYLPSLGGGFLNWDDEWLVVDNPYLDEVRGLSWILDPTASREQLGAEYLPVRDLSVWVDHLFWGLNPVGYHLGNVLLYGLVCALAFHVLRDLTQSRRAALIAALLFVVHPVHVESVAWISERKGLLAALFLLAALLAYRRGRRARRPMWIGVSIGLFVLASLSKSTVHFFALLLLALEWLDARREGRPFPTLRAGLHVLPYALVSMVTIAVNSHHQIDLGASYGWGGATPWTAVLVVGVAAARSALHLVLPVGLSADYVVDPGPAGWLGVLILGALLVTAVLAWRRSGPLAGPAVFAVLAWLPVSNLLALPNRMADRYVFFTSLGLVGVAGLVADAWMRRRASRPHLVLAAVLVLGACFGALTLDRISVWRDPLTLWRDAAGKAPLSVRSQQNLGEILLRRGETAQAIACFERMLVLEPEEGTWWLYVAQKYSDLGDPRAAEEHLREAMRRAPSHAGVRVNLAQLLAARAGRDRDKALLLAEAERLLREVVEAQAPVVAEDRIRALARLNLGTLHLSQGLMASGVEHTLRALRAGLPPRSEITARENLVRAYRVLGSVVEARHQEERIGELRRRLGPALR